MRRITVIFMLCGLTVGLLSACASAQAVYEYGSMSRHAAPLGARSMAQPIQVTVDGTPQHYAAAPYMAKTSVMVPMRDIFQSLGANVVWNGARRSVLATRAAAQIRLVVGEPYATVDGKRVALAAPAQMTRDTVFVPLRFVSEALGAHAQWDPAKRMVAIHRGATATARAPAAAQPRRLAMKKPQKPLDPPDEVQVTLTEWSIKLSPSKVTPGLIRFAVTNSGQVPHALAIAGTAERTAVIPGGERAILEVTLEAGAYTLYCPVGNHRDLGMQAKLTVQ
jgi:plastocyanin